MSTPTFIEMCVTGKAAASNIDDYVDPWHEGGDPRSLPEFLGMSETEYSLWVERPSAINVMILAHKKKVPLPRFLRSSTGEHWLLGLLRQTT